MKAISGPSLDWNNAKLKIRGENNLVKFFVFNDSEWIQLGELDISSWISFWKKSFYIGIATLSHDNTQLTKAIYSKIKLKKF